MLSFDSWFPTKVAEISMIRNTVTGWLAVVLPFDDIFLRLPGPGEGDFVVSAKRYAGEQWRRALLLCFTGTFI